MLLKLKKRQKTLMLYIIVMEQHLNVFQFNQEILYVKLLKMN